ncbi:MAG TPA: hypothetical protein VGR37_08440 [Longimicrobiaceae bacterium]|nr:hypothetical protein [Longimicrobiaceae bacterium]
MLDPEFRERIREALRTEVASRGLRVVAREVGLRPSGLRKLISEESPTTPQENTERKMASWIARRQVSATGDPYEAAGKRAALQLLRGALPRREQARLRELIRESLWTAGLPVGWMDEEV